MILKTKKVREGKLIDQYNLLEEPQDTKVDKGNHTLKFHYMLKPMHNFKAFNLIVTLMSNEQLSSTSKICRKFAFK